MSQLSIFEEEQREVRHQNAGISRVDCMPGFRSLALVTLGARQFFVAGAVLCTVGSLAASLGSAH